MACIKCNGSFLTRRRVKLKDADICFGCFKELGFDKSDILTSSLYAYDDIKDGKEEYYRRSWAKRKKEFAHEEADRLGLHFADYQALSDLDCIDNEMKAVERVCALLEDEGCSSKKISYEREPGEPLNAFLGDALLYQLRYTKDVKWIRIGADGEKDRITGPAGINKLVNKLVERYKSCL